MAVELPKLKQDFSEMIEAVTIHPFTMVQFIVWLDLKLAEYKVNGYMILDQSYGEIPDWLSKLNVDEPDKDPQEDDHEDAESQSSQDTIIQEPATQEETTQDETLQEESDSLDNIKIIPITSDALSPPPEPLPPIEEDITTDFQRDDSPILIEDASVEDRTSIVDEQHNINAGNSKSGSKRSSASDTTFSPVISQVYTDVKRRRVTPTSSPSTPVKTPLTTINIADDERLPRVANPTAFAGSPRQIGRPHPTGSRDVNRGVHIIRDPNRKIHVNPSLWDSNPNAFREAGIQRNRGRLSSNDNIAHQSSPSPDKNTNFSNLRNVGHSPGTQSRFSSSNRNMQQDMRLTSTVSRTQTSGSNLPPFTDSFTDPSNRYPLGEVSPQRTRSLMTMPHTSRHDDQSSEPVPTQMFMNNPELRNQPSAISESNISLGDPAADSAYSNMSQSENSASFDESYDNLAVDDQSDCQIKTEPPDETSVHQGIVSVTQATRSPSESTIDWELPNSSGQMIRIRPGRLGLRNGRYMQYTREIREEIGRSSLKIGTALTVLAYSKLLGHEIAKSTVRSMRLNYLKTHKNAKERNSPGAHDMISTFRLHQPPTNFDTPTTLPKTL